MFNKIKLMVLSVLAMLFGLMQSAHAALDTVVSTELATAKTDIITLGGIVFGIAVAIVLYKWFKRAL